MDKKLFFNWILNFFIDISTFCTASDIPTELNPLIIISSFII